MSPMKYTLEQQIAAFWSKADMSAGMFECWTWTRELTKDGYGRCIFQGKRQRAHRIAWTIINGSIPDGLFVCHSCDNPSCVNPTHLWLGTNQDNMDDMARKGRRKGWVKGSGIGRIPSNAKLTVDQVREIRTRYASGISRSQLANEYGVGRSTVDLIITKHRWKHVE